MQLLFRLVFLFHLAAVTAACSQLSQLQQSESAHIESDPKVGESLELLAALSVPEGEIKAWFDPAFNQQQGLSLSGLFQSNRLRNGVKCGVRLKEAVSLDGEAGQIEAGEFTVTRVSRYSDPLGIDPRTVSLYDGFADDITLIYQIEVSSEAQPEVVSFFCSQRHASLSRNTPFPNALQLRRQAEQILRWPSPTSTSQ